MHSTDNCPVLMWWVTNVNLMDIVFLKNQKSAKNGIRKPLQVNLGKYDELAVPIARSYTQTFFLCVFTEETSYPLGTSQQALQTFVQVDARKLWLCEDCFCLIFFPFCDEITCLTFNFLLFKSSTSLYFALCL